MRRLPNKTYCVIEHALTFFSVGGLLHVVGGVYSGYKLILSLMVNLAIYTTENDALR